MYATQDTPTQRTSVLGTLRALIPARNISFNEALTIAERQANKLLELHHATSTPVDLGVIANLPRIRIIYTSDLPVSGSSGWNGNDWIISINAQEPLTRQRFTLAHEYKHIIDHGHQHKLISRTAAMATIQAEQVADYFAGCLLVPKRLLKHYFCNITQNIRTLACQFDVSEAAIKVRLVQTGLTDHISTRCANILKSGVPRFQSRADNRYPAPANPSVVTGAIK